MHESAARTEVVVALQTYKVLDWVLIAAHKASLHFALKTRFTFSS